MVVKKIIFAILTFLITINLKAGTDKMIISADTLIKQLDSKDLVIIDARNTLSFIKGHIKGAVHLDGGCGGALCYKKDIPCVLKPFNEIKKILINKGICKNKKIIIYGDQYSWGAEGRIFWLLDRLGYKNIKILDQGYYYWKRKGFPVSFMSNIFNSLKKCEKLEIGKFHLINAEDINNLIKENKAIIIDTRTKKEFFGAILYGEKRGGHIPDSVFINWKIFFNKEYKLKQKKEILEILQQKGIPCPEKIEKKIITVCTGGVRSGFVYFVLKYVGYKNIENYDYGFWQWAKTNFPVEK